LGFDIGQIRIEALALLGCAGVDKVNGKAKYGIGTYKHELCMGGNPDQGVGK
jgi:hypothetical protein